MVPRELAEKPSWRRMEPTIQRMLSEFLQRDLAPAALAPEFQPTLARAITLTSVSLVMEMRFILSMEAKVALDVATGLFGPDPDAELVEDTLSELANLAMGGVKASFAEDGVTLTSGLPVSVAPRRARSERPPEARAAVRRPRWRAHRRDGRALTLSDASRAIVRALRRDDLRDAGHERGRLLVMPAGVRLSTNTMAVEDDARSRVRRHRAALIVSDAGSASVASSARR